jgi:hypothetical protein
MRMGAPASSGTPRCWCGAGRVTAARPRAWTRRPRPTPRPLPPTGIHKLYERVVASYLKNAHLEEGDKRSTGLSLARCATQSIRSSTGPIPCATKSPNGCKRRPQSPRAPIPVNCPTLVLTGTVASSRASENRRGASGRYSKLCATNRRLASCSGRRQPAATRARSPCDSVDWPSAASSSVMATVAGGSPGQTLRCRRRFDGGGGGRTSGARRHRMHAMANSYRGFNFTRRAVARSARVVP